jgi:protein LTV1
MLRKFIDKKNAATFNLVHGSQRDPLINDSESSARVVKYVPPPNAKEPPELRPTINDDALENDLGPGVDEIRENEGEAAEYGIFFDDTEYDYMQHLRPVGEAADAVLLEAPSKDKKGKVKEVFGEKVILFGVLMVAWDSKRSIGLGGGGEISR